MPREARTWKARKAASTPEMPAGTSEPVAADSPEMPACQSTAPLTDHPATRQCLSPSRIAEHAQWREVHVTQGGACVGSGWQLPDAVRACERDGDVVGRLRDDGRQHGRRSWR